MKEDQLKQVCCFSCNRPVKGRADKKFCNDYCRNNYNNRLKANTNNCIRNINNALLKNRRILESFLQEGEKMGKTGRTQMLERGFVFNYFTHRHINKTGSVYFFCYDLGYLCLGNDKYLIVKEEEYMYE